MKNPAAHHMQRGSKNQSTSNDFTIAAITSATSRNPVHQQTNEEWLRAYDAADVMCQPELLEGPF